MNPLWAVPMLVLLLGTIAAVMAFRQAQDAAADLHAQLMRLGEVRVAVARVREETARSRESLQALRHR